MHDRRPLWLCAALLLLAGLALRAWNLWAEPLWLDEAYSAYAADHGFAFLWQVVPRYETHPPVYYSLLRLWTLAFGDGLAALRALGLVAGLLTLPTMGWMAAEAALLLGWSAERRRRLQFAAFGLACVSIPLVEMSRQVRPYPLMILVYAAAIALLLRVGRRVQAGGGVGGGAFVAYLCLLEAMLWLHNLGPLYALALGIGCAVMVMRPGLARRDWIRVGGGHALVGLAYLPGLAILAGQAPTWVRTTWLRFAFDQLFFARVSNLYAVQGWPVLVALLPSGLALGWLRRVAVGRRLAALLLVAALLPVGLAVGLSLTVAPVFITRTMTPVAAPAILLLAIGATAWSDWRARAGLAAAVMLGGAMAGAGVQVRAGGPMQDWYGTVAWLQRHVGPGDQILAYPNEGALPLHYALRDRGLDYPVRPIPTAVPSFDDQGGRYPTGSRGVVSLPPERLHAIATSPDVAAIPTIWLLRLGHETYDPGDVFLRELHVGRRVVRRWRAGPIDIVGLTRRPAPVRSRR